MGENSWTSSIVAAARQIGKWAVLIFRPFHFLLYALSGLTPRDRNWWIFGSWSGLRVTDSPRALIQHLATHHEGVVRTTWLTARPSIGAEMRSEGFDSRYRWSPGGIWAALRGGIYIYDGLTRDINHWMSRGATTVNLRHGIGPKLIERSIETRSHRLYKLFHGNLLERIVWTIVLPWHNVRPNILIASSQTHAEIGVKAFGTPQENVLITGLPRHDILFDQASRPYMTDEELQAIASLNQSTQPVFLYMPTFRDLKSGDRFNWDAMNRAALAAGVQIHVKLHLVDENRRTAVMSELDDCDALTWISPSVDPMTLYAHADALITDFSSVAIDMMLLRKPIIYYIPDYEFYTEGRTLYFPFDQISPGPRCKTFEELAAALSRFSDGELREYRGKYDEVAGMFYKYQDGLNSCRVFEGITQYLRDL